MAAVVTPVCVEDTELGLYGVTSLLAEVVNNLAQVVGIHRQAITLAVLHKLLILHIAEAFEHSHRLNLSTLSIAEHLEILLTRLYGIDKILLDASHILGRNALVEYIEARRFNLNLGIWLDKVYTIYGRSSALIELTWQELDSQEWHTLHIALIGNSISNHLAKDSVAATLQQLIAETEEVVNVDITELLDA